MRALIQRHSSRFRDLLPSAGSDTEEAFPFHGEIRAFFLLRRTHFPVWLLREFWRRPKGIHPLTEGFCEAATRVFGRFPC